VERIIPTIIAFLITLLFAIVFKLHGFFGFFTGWVCGCLFYSILEHLHKHYK